MADEAVIRIVVQGEDGGTPADSGGGGTQKPNQGQGTPPPTPPPPQQTQPQTSTPQSNQSSQGTQTPPPQKPSTPSTVMPPAAIPTGAPPTSQLPISTPPQVYAEFESAMVAVGHSAKDAAALTERLRQSGRVFASVQDAIQGGLQYGQPPPSSGGSLPSPSPPPSPGGPPSGRPPPPPPPNNPPPPPPVKPAFDPHAEAQKRLESERRKEQVDAAYQSLNPPTKPPTPTGPPSPPKAELAFDPHAEATTQRESEIRREQIKSAYDGMYGSAQKTKSSFDFTLDFAQKMRGTLGGSFGMLVGATLDIIAMVRAAKAAAGPGRESVQSPIRLEAEKRNAAALAQQRVPGAGVEITPPPVMTGQGGQVAIPTTVMQQPATPPLPSMATVETLAPASTLPPVSQASTPSDTPPEVFEGYRAAMIGLGNSEEEASALTDRLKKLSRKFSSVDEAVGEMWEPEKTDHSPPISPTGQFGSSGGIPNPLPVAVTNFADMPRGESGTGTGTADRSVPSSSRPTQSAGQQPATAMQGGIKPSPSIGQPPVGTVAQGVMQLATAGAPTAAGAGTAPASAVGATSAAAPAAVVSGAEAAGASLASVAPAAAGAAAALGPVGIAALAAAAAVGVFAVSVMAVSKVLNAAAEQYGQYNAELSQAQAMAEVRQIQGDLRRSEQVGPGLAKFIEAQSLLSQDFQDLKATLVEILAPIGTAMMDFIRFFMPLFKAIFDFVATIADTVGDFLEILAQILKIISLGFIDLTRRAEAATAGSYDFDPTRILVPNI